MALETCFCVGTTAAVAGPRASRAHRLGLPTGRRSTSFSLPTASSPLPLSFYRSSVLPEKRSGRGRSARIVCEAKNVVSEVGEVTEKTWAQLVVENDKLVLVDFWAPWCGPCRMIDPVIAELAKEYAGKVACLKLNTDDSPNIATQYGIRSIPTMLIFKDGERKESIIGAVPKGTLTSTLDKYLEM